MAANAPLYREMLIPFENPEAADKAYQEFFEELGELRKKHKLTNLYFIVNASYMKEGEEQEFYVTGNYGSSTMAEAMTAYAFGHEQAKRQAGIDEILSLASKGARKRAKS